MQPSHTLWLENFLRRAVLISASLVLAACASTDSQQRLSAQVVALEQQLDSLENQLSATRAELAERDALAETTSALLTEEVAGLGTRLAALPEELAKVCPGVAEATRKSVPECTAGKVEIRTVTLSNDKLVLGDLERVRIDPPGAYMVARVDTGAESSYLHAKSIVEFERDGQRWVRFDIALEAETATIERPIKRFARVLQPADPEGSRRPAVELRIRIGNVRQSVEFTLADRSHLDNEMLLGRNFLTDLAVVDVGRQFVQRAKEAKNKGQ